MRSKAKHDEWQKLLLCKQIILNGADDLGANFKKVQVEMKSVMGRTVTLTVDRPLGSYHPEHEDMYYPINYGYVEGIMAPNGEEQDAYILGVDEAVEMFTGTIIAIIHSSFRGNVYSVQGEEILCESVTGFADLANEMPNTLETKFASALAGKVLWKSMKNCG